MTETGKILFRQKLKNFDVLKTATLEEKTTRSRELIESALKRFEDNICVACSFGKDSTVVLDLVRQFRPNVKVVFANTGVEYPQTLSFRDYLVKKWRLNYHEQHPIKPFMQCVKEYGWPNKRLSSKSAKGRKMIGEKSDKPKCYSYCKDMPCSAFYKKNNIQAVFLGLSYEESYQRRYAVIRYSDFYFHKKEAIWKVLPIAYWTAKDVWQYTREHDLPVNTIYASNDRNGCMPCTSFIGWEKQIARANPKLFRWILKHKVGMKFKASGQTFLDESFSKDCGEPKKVVMKQR